MKLYKCKLSDLGTVNRGKSKHRPRNDASLFGGEYPFIQTGEVKATEFYLNSFSETYNEKGLAQSKLWDKGTLLITISANIAETAILDIKACFPDSIIGFIPFENKSDVRFVKYYMEYIKKKLQNISQGTTQDNMSVKKLLSMWLYVPDYKNQVKIADTISSYDKLIENNNQRIKLLESMAEEIYKEWFVRLRFPEFEKVEILDGVPFGWEEKKIKDFGVVITGKTPSTTNEDYYGGNIPFIKTPDMRKYPYVDSSNEYLTKEGANSQNNKFLDKNTLIVGCIGSKAGAYSLVQEKSQTNQQINAIKFFKDEYTFYMYNFASNFSVILNLLGSNGATMTNVNKSKFENIDVLMPSFDILSKYHVLIKNNFEMIFNLQQKNKNLKETRDLLLPKLIHGTLKV